MVAIAGLEVVSNTSGDLTNCIVCISTFAFPETGVKISIVIGKLAVGLSAKGIAIYPDGFECFGIKSLNGTAVKTNEDKSFAIGKRADCKGIKCTDSGYLFHCRRLRSR